MAIEGVEVNRQYNVLPAIEQTKILIINKLSILFDAINNLMQTRMMGKLDNEMASIVKSTTITLYILLKPKIVDYIESNKKIIGMSSEQQDKISSLKSLYNINDCFKKRTSLEVEDAINYADIINLFCHEYGITRIQYFAGTTIGQIGDKPSMV
jgi:hypothetical protein